MRRILINLLRFSLIPLVFISFFEFQLRYKNSFKLKADYLELNKRNIELLVLGSSHHFRAIDPGKLHMNSASLSVVGSTLNLDYLLFQNYINELPNLKVLILEMSYHSLEEYKGSDYSRNNLYYTYFNVNNYEDGVVPILDYSFFLSSPRQYFLHVIKDIAKPSKMNEHGFVLDPRESKGKNTLPRTNADLHSNDNKENLRKNVACLQKIIETCQVKGIKVILLSPPKYITYNKRMSHEKLQRRDSVVRTLLSENVEFWNYEKNYENEISLFKDFNHLNPLGAEVFTNEINLKLKEAEFFK